VVLEHGPHQFMPVGEIKKPEVFGATVLNLFDEEG
jgi:hypothetical protein